MAHSGFWETMSILVDKDWNKLAMEDIQDWLDKILMRRECYIIEDDDVSVIAKRRKLSLNSECEIRGDADIKKFLKGLKLPKIECKNPTIPDGMPAAEDDPAAFRNSSPARVRFQAAGGGRKSRIVDRFSHPQTRSRLEKLMGSNLVSLTDRTYMQRLQERILEDYAESMDKRIKARENEEMERVKNLVLIGKIPINQAPPEMAQHPVMLIENQCNKLIAERRAKIRIRKVKIPIYLYWDDTPDPPSGLSIERGHVFRKQGERMCIPYNEYLQSTEEEDIERGYMLSPEEFDKIKYENPMVKELMNCETVEAMYTVAEEIIGLLKTIDESTRVRDTSKPARLSNATKM